MLFPSLTSSFIPHDRLAAGAFACLNVYDLYKKYGTPRFSSDYGMLIIPDPSTMKVFLGSLLGLAMRPYLFAIAPVFISEGSAFLPEVFAVSSLSLPLC